MPIARTNSSTERVETPWTPAFAGAGSGLLDHRRQRLLGQAAGFEEGREIAALAQLGNPQLDRPGAGLPIPVAIPVSVREPVGAAFAMRRTGQVLYLQLHQPMRRKPDHLAQQIGVRTLLQKRL